MRRKNFLAGAAAVATIIAGSGSAFAADTQLTWQGLVTVTAVTAACGTSGAASVGDIHVAIYRPKIEPTDTETYLAIYSLRSVVDFKNASEATRPQMHGAGNYAATAINSRAKPFTNTGTYSLAIAPAAIVASTPTVTIKGKLTNYFAQTGCTVTFTGLFSERPS